MTQIYYDLKLFFKEKIIVFWSLIFPILLTVLIVSLFSNTKSSNIKIGIPENSSFKSEDTIIVKDYIKELENENINIYFGEDKVYLKTKNSASKFMIEEINYKIQNGQKDYTITTYIKHEVSFFIFLSMQALYSGFLAILLFEKYSKNTGIGKRIILGKENIFKLKAKTFINTFLIHNLVMTFLFVYLSNHITIGIKEILLIELLTINGISIGLVISTLLKTTPENKSMIGVTILQIMLMLGGGFGLMHLQYTVSNIPGLKFLSPVLITNRLAKFKLDIIELSYLMILPIILISFSFIKEFKKGGK